MKETPISGSWLAWHVGAVALLLLAPTRLLLGQPLSSLAPNQLLFVVGLPVSYTAAVAALSYIVYRTGRLRLHHAVVTMGVLLGILYLALLLVPDQRYSRSALLAGSALSGLLIGIPAILTRYRFVVLLLLIVGIAGLSGLRTSLLGGSEPRRSISAETGIIHATHGSLRAVRYENHIERPLSTGGALALLGERYLLVTGAGDFFSLAWDRDSDELRVDDMDLRVPLNRSEFEADTPADVDASRFRVAGLLLTRSGGGDGIDVVVSHHYWKRHERCFVLRVSSTTVAEADMPANPGAPEWRTLYDTRPCLPIKPPGEGHSPFGGHHSGGRLAALPSGDILLTVGDHQFDGWNSERQMPQDTAADYGKVIRLAPDGAGKLETVTMGHRNPLGLHVRPDGTIWVASNGPEGGDKLAEIVPGRNYGWPFNTYGTDYGDVTWPLQVEGGPAAFSSPLFVWVPSIAPTNLITVTGAAFPEWEGDLLVASLRDEALHRVRIDGDRVLYTERIPIGQRIRDIIMGPDGRIVLWSDDGTIRSLTPATQADDGAVAFRQCLACHGVTAEAGHGIGPSLEGIFGRPMAGQAGFAYSTALGSMGGRWTFGRLDEFLADPAAFAPGTTMEFRGIQDRAARLALIEYLKTL